MTFRIISHTVLLGCLLWLLAIGAAFAQHTKGPHNWHPEWLKRTGCCGPRDCFRLQVQYTPVGWRIIAMRLKPTDPWMPPPGLIVVPEDKISASKDGKFWGCFHLDSRGRPTTVFYKYYTGGQRKTCFFQPGSGQ